MRSCCHVVRCQVSGVLRDPRLCSIGWWWPDGVDQPSASDGSCLVHVFGTPDLSHELHSWGLRQPMRTMSHMRTITLLNLFSWHAHADLRSCTFTLFHLPTPSPCCSSLHRLRIAPSPCHGPHYDFQPALPVTRGSMLSNSALAICRITLTHWSLCGRTSSPTVPASPEALQPHWRTAQLWARQRCYTCALAVRRSIAKCGAACRERNQGANTKSSAAKKSVGLELVNLAVTHV